MTIPRHVNFRRPDSRWRRESANEEALRVLSKTLPEADSPLEEVWLRERLITCTTRAAAAVHRRFHTVVSPGSCSSSPLESAVSIWSDPSLDARSVLGHWTETFFSDFDAHHRRPVAGRVVAALRERFAQPLTLERLARLVGLSKSGVTREFRAGYGVSIGEYRTRLRLRWAIEQLRAPGSNVESIARLAGYRSPKNFYRALETRLSVGPSAIRRLSEEELPQLIDWKLSIAPSLSSNRRSTIHPHSQSPIRNRPSGL